MKRRLLQHFSPLILLVSGLIMMNQAKAQVPATAAAYPFTATTEPYVYVTGGTNVSLQGDDVTVTGIPIGFTFPFTTGTYTTVSACTNGWLSLANSTSTTWTNSSANIGTIGPAVFPLFDDQWGTSGTATFSYITTGTAPNRIFTFEWRAIDFPRLSVPGALSFQVKLFENGMIKFCYKQEPPATSGTASGSIGIGRNATDWLALSDASAAPTASSTSFATGITNRPATDQVYIFGAPPCLYAPVNGNFTNATSSKATINWSHSANGVPPQDYEIVIDQTPGNPTASGISLPSSTNSYTKTGLTPGTSYYAHVRGRCSGLSVSSWLHIPFATTQCVAPNVSMANITHESALALWQSLPPAVNYQYIYNTTGVPPTSDAGAGNTTTNSAQLSGLDPDTHYYLYMRTQCLNNETSDWEPTEFTTMVECQAPEITVINMSATDKEATWNEIPTAVAYEYAVNSVATPPSLGKIIYENDVKFTIPNDDKGYYLHVRAKCVSIFTSSEWSTKVVREPSETAISNVNGNGQLLIMAYPNPAKNTITVDLNGLQNKAGSLTLSDITGKVVYSTQATAASVSIDMSSMPAGIYLLKYADTEQNQVLKITKQ